MPTNYETPEPRVDTRVRVYANILHVLWQQYHPHPESACEGRSIMLRGSEQEQCIAALRAISVKGPFPHSDAITVLVAQQTTSGPHVLTTWRIDIKIHDEAAHARVYGTRPRLDINTPVSSADDVVTIAIKVLQAGGNGC